MPNSIKPPVPDDFHAPYDTVAIFGEQRNGRWLLTDVVGKPYH